MEKRVYDKKTGIYYELQGDYYLPCLELPEQPKIEIGMWGKRMNHIRNRATEIVNKNIIYN